jgi:hypothetical protein
MDPVTEGLRSCTGILGLFEVLLLLLDGDL